MKTIGEILKDARVKRKFSLRKVEDVTKIKSHFIDLIEKEKWDTLPAFPTVLGFVKSLAGTLGVDEKMAIAVLKRDYPPKKLTINPKPDVSSRFSWSPRMSFAIGIIAFLLLIFGYLGFQFFKFSSPPALSVDSPKEGQVVTGNSVAVFGSTDPDAKVTVNNQPVLTDQDGKFSVDINVVPETKEIIIQAVARSGKQTTITRKITVQ